MGLTGNGPARHLTALGRAGARAHTFTPQARRLRCAHTSTHRALSMQIVESCMAYEARGWRYRIEAACLEVYKEVPISALRALIMPIRVLIMPLRVLIMPLRVLIMPLRVLVMPPA